jgi:hypothetical protein
VAVIAVHGFVPFLVRVIAVKVERARRTFSPPHRFFVIGEYVATSVLQNVESAAEHTCLILDSIELCQSRCPQCDACICAWRGTRMNIVSKRREPNHNRLQRALRRNTLGKGLAADKVTSPQPVR